MKCTTILLIYNEEDTIAPQTEDILRVYDEEGIDGEVLLVDDGSEDRSPEVCDDLTKKYDRVRVIYHQPNKGRSFAIQTGFNEARGEVSIIMDGDRQYEPREIPQFLAKIDEGYDVVTGYRHTRADVFYRRWESIVYNRLIIKRMFGVDVLDQNSGFKAFVTQGARRMDFNPEGYLGLHRYILPVAALAGLSIVEIPISHYPRKEGKSYIKFYTVPFLALRDYRKFVKDNRDRIKAMKKRKKQGN